MSLTLTDLLRQGTMPHMNEVPETATSATRGVIPPPPPAAPPRSDDSLHESGLVHEAGPLRDDGTQQCRRCGLELSRPLSRTGGDPGVPVMWEVGGLVEHRRLSNGERMTSIGPPIFGRESTLPDCEPGRTF